MIRKLIYKMRKRRFCKLNRWFCPDCIYHDFVFEGAIFRGNRCRYPKYREKERGMTREEAIQHFKEQLDIFGGEHAEAIKVAIEALKNKSRPFGDCSKCTHTYGTLGCCTTVSNEWVYDCEHGMKQYKNTKAEPSEDRTLEVKVEDATKVGRVLISDDKHRGGLYYPDEYEPRGDDLISRAEAIEALGEEPPVWCDEEYEIAERDQWRADIEAIKSVPSVDRPRGKWIYWREDGIKRCKCSRCLTSYGCLDTPYCPNCGKKMVKGRSEE